MAIGFRAFLEFERPDSALVDAYRGIPSANIGDCVLRMNCMFGGIRPFNDRTLVGTAFTVKVPSGDNLAAQMALDYIKPGDILVIDGAGYTDRALVGGMMLAYAQERKLGGFVVNGAVRDLEDIQKSPIPVFALAATPLGPYRDGPGEVNVPVVCGGQVVMPGDIIVGDADGVVVVSKRDAAVLLTAVYENLKNEQEEMQRMRDGSYTQQQHLDTFTGQFIKNGGKLVQKAPIQMMERKNM